MIESFPGAFSQAEAPTGQERYDDQTGFSLTAGENAGV